MRLFVYEFICGGGWSDRPLDGSLLAEGRAMHTAVLADFARVPGCSVVTTCDARLDRPALDNVTVARIADPAQDRRLFRQLAAECDAVFVIAPECHGILAERHQWVTEAGGTFLGPSQTAIELCADKLRLARHLFEHGIATIPTERLSAQRGMTFPAVIKPRDGAGSQQTFLVASQCELDRATESLTSRSLTEGAEPFEGIRQPYIPGDSLSIVALITSAGSQMELLPLAEQRLSDDGRFRYLGGRVPASVRPAQGIKSLIERCVQSIPGLQGYVGFDLILPTGQTTREPLIVEINPRLTTSYLGYRALTSDNLAERILFPDRIFAELSWQDEPVEFEMQNSECENRRARFRGLRSNW